MPHRTQKRRIKHRYIVLSIDNLGLRRRILEIYITGPRLDIMSRKARRIARGLGGHNLMWA